MSGVRVELKSLTKVYEKAGEQIRVLAAVDLVLEPGTRVAILGPSGAGKSTFLHLLGLLDHPTSGQVTLDGVDVSAQPPAVRHRMRNRSIGFVFQAHNLLPEHTAISNVSIPVRLAGGSVEVSRARAKALLDAVGIGHRLEHKPGELSGGEQQRVAIARALVMGPGLVLADEPTGNLDPRTSGSVFDVFMDLNEQLGSTLVVVTHSHELAARFPRRLVLEEGRFRDA